ncbi:hypothetical protein ACH41E_33495 [Streptomyces sp. NPDC020412]|uniref:hypothetical protein n=1 Tax=Streptomyces sp. NPDC020412 TaxID=3365073 RepID=UPI00378B0AA2
MIRCDVAAWDYACTRSWLLARYESEASPRVAVRWLRAEAAMLASRLDLRPHVAWAPPSALTPELVPTEFDAAAGLRLWVVDTGAQDSYMHQLHTLGTAVVSVTGLDAVFTLTTTWIALRPLTLLPEITQ